MLSERRTAPSERRTAPSERRTARLPRALVTAAVALCLVASCSSGSRTAQSSSAQSTTTEAPFGTPTSVAKFVANAYPICKLLPLAVVNTATRPIAFVHATPFNAGLCAFTGTARTDTLVVGAQQPATLGPNPGADFTIPGLGPARWIESQHRLVATVGRTRTVIVVAPYSPPWADRALAVRVATLVAPRISGAPGTN